MHNATVQQYALEKAEFQANLEAAVQQGKEAQKIEQIKKILFSDVKVEEEKAEEKKGENEGRFKCPKCQQNKTTYYSVQKRFADEPMTNFVYCGPCDHHFKK